MAGTAKGTIEAVISEYQAANITQLMKEFHTNAKIRGSKKRDKWEKKADAKAQVADDMNALTFGGRFVTGPVQPHEMIQLAPGVMLFDRSDRLTISDQSGGTTNGEARWSAVVKQYSDGWKITHSHFSMEEGFLTP